MELFLVPIICRVDLGAQVNLSLFHFSREVKLNPRPSHVSWTDVTHANRYATPVPDLQLKPVFLNWECRRTLEACF